MLILSRKAGEKVVIDGNITLEIVRIQGNRVTVGIAAPSNVKILRGELDEHPSATQTVELVANAEHADELLQAC